VVRGILGAFFLFFKGQITKSAVFEAASQEMGASEAHRATIERNEGLRAVPEIKDLQQMG